MVEAGYSQAMDENLQDELFAKCQKLNLLVSDILYLKRIKALKKEFALALRQAKETRNQDDLNKAKDLKAKLISVRQTLRKKALK